MWIFFDEPLRLLDGFDIHRRWKASGPALRRDDFRGELLGQARASTGKNTCSDDAIVHNGGRSRRAVYDSSVRSELGLGCFATVDPYLFSSIASRSCLQSLPPQGFRTKTDLDEKIACGFGLATPTRIQPRSANLARIAGDPIVRNSPRRAAGLAIEGFGPEKRAARRPVGAR
jgi:hypothetical protein